MPIQLESTVCPQVTMAKVVAVASGIRLAVERMGRPLTIGNKALATLYGIRCGFSASDIQRIGRSTVARIELWRQLGGREWGARPEYQSGDWRL